MAGRAGAIRTRAVERRTTLLLLRLRYDIVTRRGDDERSLLVEDCRIAAFRGAPESAEWLDTDAAEALWNVEPDENVNPDVAGERVAQVVRAFEQLRAQLDEPGSGLGSTLRNRFGLLPARTAGAKVWQAISGRERSDLRKKVLDLAWARRYNRLIRKDCRLKDCSQRTRVMRRWPRGQGGLKFCAERMSISTLQNSEWNAAWAGVQSLDFRSRAVASLVDDWRLHKSLRWDLSAVIREVREALDIAAATRVSEIFDGDTPDRGAVVQVLTTFLLGVRRLEESTKNFAEIIDMLQDLKVDVGTAAEIHQYNSELAALIAKGEGALDELEWLELEETALPSDRVDSIAGYLKSTRQASA